MGYFPVVLVNKDRKRFHGTAGLRLQGFLKGDLLLFDSNAREQELPQLNRMSVRVLQSGRESFLQALAGLPDSVVLELHLFAQPNLANQANSSLEITLLLRGEADSAQEVKELLLSRFLVLKPLFATHLPEADFRPITEVEELRARLAGPAPWQAVAIRRRREEIDLSSLVRKRAALGFGASQSGDEAQSEREVVEHIYPWAPAGEDWEKLTGMLLAQTDGVRVVVRLRAIRADKAALTHLSETVATCDRFLAGAGPEQASLGWQAQLIRKQALRQLANLPEASFQLGVFLLTDTDHRLLAQVLGKAITGLGSRFDDDNQGQGGFEVVAIAARKALALNSFPEKEPFTAAETSCAFRLPTPPFTEQPGLPIRRFRTSLALLPGRRDGDAVSLGVNEHQGHEQLIGVGLEDRFRHAFILGMTGTGKSHLMESMILQDIQAGRGVAVIDPHGEMVDSILSRIPPERAEDVIYFNPLDTERPIGFNVLAWKTLEERDLIIDEIYQTLDRIYDMHSTGGPIFENHYRGMMKLLMGDKPRENFTPTLLEFAKCYVDKEFRDYLANNVDDPVLADFLVEMERAGGDASMANIAPYISSKFARFSQDTTLRRIFGQEKTCIDFDEVLAKGRIVLVSLGKGRFGSTTSGLLANLLVSRFKLATMKRAQLAPSERPPFFLYVDEAHNLPADNFMELLSEARKYRLGLVMATQYAAQLTTSKFGSRDNLLSAILGNVGQTIIFRLGQEDAELMAPALTPYFSEKDIMGLPNWHGYARMQLNNEAVAPFSFKTLRNDPPKFEGMAQKIRILSRLKYGQDVSVVDHCIRIRREAWKNREV